MSACRTLLALVLLLGPLSGLPLAGCGDSQVQRDGSDGDGGPDGTGGPCPEPMGEGGTPGQIISAVGVAEASVGFDLDGDTFVDNRLAVLSIVNEPLALALAEGRLIQLVELRDFDDPVNDDRIEVLVHEGMDADDAACNNLGGQGRFRIVRSGQKGKSFVAVGTIMNGKLVVLTNDSLTISDGELTATLRSPRIVARVVDSQGTLADGVIGGVVQACDLQRIDPQLGTGLNTLETLLQLNTLPDVDFDGDGMEQVEVDDDNRVARCTDGDGTVIEGADCVCDPRIADGYSVALTFATMPAVFE